jgi:choline dehydrogenase-like flavoprotein
VTGWHVLTESRLLEVREMSECRCNSYQQSVIGGLAGCVVASRLAEADRNLVILVIEQGPNNYGMPEVVHPALYPRNLFPSSKITLFWQTKKSPQLGNRSPIVPSGGTLGGGSAMNWMVYTRAQRSDFDSWKTPGWSADEMLPFLKKVCPLSAYYGLTGSVICARVPFEVNNSEDSLYGRRAPCSMRGATAVTTVGTYHTTVLAAVYPRMAL